MSALPAPGKRWHPTLSATVYIGERRERKAERTLSGERPYTPYGSLRGLRPPHFFLRPGSSLSGICVLLRRLWSNTKLRITEPFAETLCNHPLEPLTPWSCSWKGVFHFGDTNFVLYCIVLYWNSPTSFVHWAGGLHWGKCFGKSLSFQYVCKITLYTVKWSGLHCCWLLLAVTLLLLIMLLILS